MIQVNLWDKINRIKWNLLVVYGAAHEQKLKFLSELSSFCSKNSDPILIGGDFNILRYAHERNKPNGIQRFSDLFNTLISFHELREIIMTGGLFTWSNNQENPTLEKLDRILISKDWEDIFPHALVRKFPREISDHNPLILTSRHCASLKYI
jgi:exonuclease III